MITTEDIKHLADLSRMEISDAEMEKLTAEIDAILGYVGQIINTTGDMTRTVPLLHNVMREDEPQNKSGEYMESILANVPAREGNYLKVKKILGGNSDDII
jgi:aspartyl-tRNA(Asn)/glutamyl-tRNA(Gln) amidotransferase subunit C